MGKKLPFLTRPIVVTHSRNAQNQKLNIKLSNLFTLIDNLNFIDQIFINIDESD
jgi:hypothetical protein